MFDDSFEHEVTNACVEDRVVFQVAIRHPDLQSDPASRSIVRDAH
jgi:hypothetical protein